MSDVATITDGRWQRLSAHALEQVLERHGRFLVRKPGGRRALLA